MIRNAQQSSPFKKPRTDLQQETSSEVLCDFRQSGNIHRTAPPHNTFAQISVQHGFRRLTSRAMSNRPMVRVEKVNTFTPLKRSASSSDRHRRFRFGDKNTVTIERALTGNATPPLCSPSATIWPNATAHYVPTNCALPSLCWG